MAAARKITYPALIRRAFSLFLRTAGCTFYQKQVLIQQQYDSSTLPYRRGDIVDAKGTRLATSEKVYNLVIDAKVMNTNRSEYRYNIPPARIIPGCPRW